MTEHSRLRFPNMILLAGDGRNVGKTTFATNIIRHFSASAGVKGLKISQHIHPLNEGLDVLYRDPDFVVAEEKGESNKDSSLFLQAGANEVFFIMAKKGFLEQAFRIISEKLKKHIIVAESGGLIELVEPGIFFFLKNHENPVEKKHYLAYKPVIVYNDGQAFDFEIENLSIEKGNIIQKKVMHGNL